MRTRSGWTTRIGCCAAAALLTPVSACMTGDVYRARLRSPNPLERAGAAVALAEAGDAQAVHHLVDLLEDRDPGVRLFAIQALVRLCGSDYGYRYYHDEARRGAAVERWREALRHSEIIVNRPAAETPPPDRDASLEAAACGTDGDDGTP